MQQMGDRVIGAKQPAARAVDPELDGLADFQASVGQSAEMNVQIPSLFYRVAHRQLGAVGRENDPAVTHLAARFRIERRLVDDDANVVAGLSLGDALPIAHDRVDDALGVLGLIAEKLGGADLLAQREPYRLGRRLARSNPALARFLALMLHCRREALDRHPAALT